MTANAGDTVKRENSNIGLAFKWAEKFNTAILKENPENLSPLFIDQCHWRDLLALTWRIETCSGRQSVQEKIIISAKTQGMRNFRIDKRRSIPKLVERAGKQCIEAFACFDTNVAKCVSVLRLTPDGKKAWTFMSALELSLIHI